jgi:serine/threonine protein kinase
MGQYIGCSRLFQADLVKDRSAQATQPGQLPMSDDVFLDRYENLGLLGQGSMNNVYIARPIDDRATTVIIKVMKSELAKSERGKEFYEREVRYTSRLDHPYVVKILDSGIDPHYGCCLVMEFVPGMPFDKILEKTPCLDPIRMGRLLGFLCHALESAHLSAVIHRDLKPANLMVVNQGTEQEFLKVLDFGLAQIGDKLHLTSDQLKGSDTVRTQGTPAYISPEQLRGDDVDGRADIYSVGIILYEALTGQHPFPFDSVVDLITAHLSKRPLSFAELGVHDLPKELEAVVFRCLEKYAPGRFSRARDLAIAYGRAMQIEIWEETKPAEAGEVPPLAEEVAIMPDYGPNAVVHQAESWVPSSQIAAMKVGSFMAEMGAVIEKSDPGLIKAKLLTKKPGFFGKLLGEKEEGVQLELHLDRPNTAESRLVITAVFHTLDGKAPPNPHSWASMCEGIFNELRKYLLVG